MPHIHSIQLEINYIQGRKNIVFYG